MVYDWVEPDWSQLGGLAYAWAEKPEGPFHRAPQPITRNRELTPLLGQIPPHLRRDAPAPEARLDDRRP